jgi:hypothetical protein
MVGEDDKVNFDDHSGIWVIISASATSQSSHVTAKIIGSGIRTVACLKEVIQNDTLNVIISKRGKPKFNKVTIIGIDSTLKSDFIRTGSKLEESIAPYSFWHRMDPFNIWIMYCRMVCCLTPSVEPKIFVQSVL